MVAAGEDGRASAEASGTARHSCGRASLVRRTGVPRSRDTCAPGLTGTGAAPEGVRHRPGRAVRARRSTPLSAHVAGVRDEEAPGRGADANLSARPGVSERRAGADAPSRIHDAGMVP